MNTTSRRRRAGEILTFGFQADVYGGQYQLIERTGPGKWLAMHLPPTEAEVEKISADPYYREHGGAERVISDRLQQAGETFPIRFVSAARYADYF